MTAICKAVATVACVHLFLQISAQEKHISEYRWEQRLLILDVSDLSHEAVQMHRRHARSSGYAERQLLLLIHTRGQYYDSDLERISFDAGSLAKELTDADQVLLVGKDGGVKLKAQMPLEDSKLFAVIDRMPMRRHEMQKQKKN